MRIKIVVTNTIGRQLLCKWLRANKGQNASQSSLARAMKIGQPSVSSWCRGVNRPDIHRRNLLELITGIPADSWLTPREQVEIEEAFEYVKKSA